ncbi:MAG TPA: hypothetical protein P5262_04620 [Candidatus Moranbacteria bacterium]|nr:hypothetical protein [Candidatus Moranbacteria bacterium]
MPESGFAFAKSEANFPNQKIGFCKRCPERKAKNCHVFAASHLNPAALKVRGIKRKTSFRTSRVQMSGEQKARKQSGTGNFWSAAENSTAANAWNVNFSTGGTNNNNKTNSNYVRCVRG